MKKFGKECLTALPKQGNAMIAFGMGKIVKSSCKTPDDRETLYKRLKCIRKIHDLVNVRVIQVANTFLRMLEINTNDRLAGICCIFFDFKDELITAAAAKCPKQDVDYFNMFLDGFSGDILDLLCSSFPAGSEKCQRAIQKIPKRNVSENETSEFTSMIPPLLLVLDSL